MKSIGSFSSFFRSGLNRLKSCFAGRAAEKWRKNRCYRKGVASLVLMMFASIAQARPNIIFIFADDLGYGDVGAYGATDIRTPHIDRLAAEGMRFTDFYAASNTCSPSRAALLTGRYPLRSGVNAVLFHDTMEGLPPEELTIAEVLYAAGYNTAMVGKWHLGHLPQFMPLNQGFEEFFGVPYSNDEKNFFVYDGEQRIAEAVDQQWLIKRYTERALEYIRRKADSEQPFFLYLAHNAPHVPLYPSPDFQGKSQRGIYGDVVEELDWSVGQILQALEQHDIDHNTLVVFSSDNGAWLAMRDHGGSNGVLRDGKMSAFEGGQRVPTLARWPGQIPAGEVYTEMANMMDWLPTFAALAQQPLPTDLEIDGVDITAVLRGEGEHPPGPFFYFQLRPPKLAGLEHKLAGVRDNHMKLKLPREGFYPAFLEPLMKVGLYGHDLLLFDLQQDPGEQHNLASKNRGEVERLQNLINEFERNVKPGKPVEVSAAPEDQKGWENMWQGIVLTAALVLLSVILLLYAVVKLLANYLGKNRS